MKKQTLKAGIAVLIMSTMLSGCGSASFNEANSYAPYDEMAAGATSDVYVNSRASKSAAADDAYYEEADYAEDAGAPESGADILDDSASNRKLIRNANLSVETEEFDDLISTVEGKVKALGGYIENSYTNNGSGYARNGYQNKRNASLTIRIPAEKLDEFLNTVSEKSNVTSKNESVTDVTLQYVDLESRKKTLKAEQDRLIEMIEQAETVEDMITIESRLSDVRYELESQEAQLRTFDNQINYSTVYLDISEVTKYTPVKEQTFFEKIADGFSDNLVDVLNGFVNFIIWFITSLPHLVVWFGILFAIIKFIIRKISDHKECKKRGITKKQLKAERKAAKSAKKAAKKAAKTNGAAADSADSADNVNADNVNADNVNADNVNADSTNSADVDSTK